MRYVIAVSLAAALLALPAQAGAYVKIDQGIAGARLGNTQAQVKAALGEPSLVKTGTNDFGPFSIFYYEGGLRVTFQGNEQVSSVYTTGKGDRTTKGIGVGNTEKALRQKHSGLVCEGSGDFRFCRSQSLEAGERVTVFRIKSGKITQITVAFVLD
jgi:hypothetical protein